MQVLEDLHGAMPWIEAWRERQAEAAAWQVEYGEWIAVERAIAPPVDAAVESLWKRIQSQLQLRLYGRPIAGDLLRARPINLAGQVLTVQMPSERIAEWFHHRLKRPVAQSVAAAVDHPLTIAFVGPSTALSLASNGV